MPQRYFKVVPLEGTTPIVVGWLSEEATNVILEPTGDVDDALSVRLNTFRNHALVARAETDDETFWLGVAELAKEHGFKLVDVSGSIVSMRLEFDDVNGRCLGEAHYENGADRLLGDLPRQIREFLLRPPPSALQQLELAEDAARRGEFREAWRILHALREVGALLPKERLSTLCYSIPSHVVEKETLLEFLLYRVQVAVLAGRHGDGEPDAVRALSEYGDGINARERQWLQLFAAQGAQKLGRHDTACLRFEELLSTTELPPGLRAEAYMGLARTLKDGPDAIAQFRAAADTYLEAGNLFCASGANVSCAELYGYQSPTQALELLAEADCWLELDGTSLKNRGARAWIAEQQGRLLLDVQGADAAYAYLETSNRLRRGVVGLEPDLATALALTAVVADELGRGDEAASAREESKRLVAELNLPDVDARMRIANAIRTTDRVPVSLDDPMVASNDELKGLLLLASSVESQGVTYDEAIQKLDQARQLLARSVPSLQGRAEYVVEFAAAEWHRKNGRIDLALGRYREALRINPYFREGRQNYAHTLFAEQRWDEASAFFKQELERFGELPELLYGYGRALYGLRDFKQTVVVLNTGCRAVAQNHPLARHLREWRNRALDEVGAEVDLSEAAATEQAQPVGRAEWEAQLQAFGTHVASEQRQKFWRSGKWVSHPEQFAKAILQSFLEGRLGSRVEVLEEVPAGAGRIDLYIQLRGGLRIVIELKMCGMNYSASGALAGIEQLEHYMNAKGTALGYLLVFDGRVRDYGAGLNGWIRTDASVIRSIAIDVRRGVLRRHEDV